MAAVLLPLAAAVINVLIPVKAGKLSGWISAVCALASCYFSAVVFSNIWNTGYNVHLRETWFTVGDTTIYAGILLNNLSVLMLLLVNLIALPVIIYSTAYMQYDENYKRYFTYLSFFCFSMLALVVVDNLVLLYAFWELVGFSSYLLIGFWFKKDSATRANKKAFIMNRIGDIGLLTAILILFTQFHTFDIAQLFTGKSLVTQSLIRNSTWIASTASLPAVYQYIAFAGIFLAVAAKSAQFPLHTWLPDAMEGPTSVSALIHAATMVAAGVFLLGRVYPLFNDAELSILAAVGCFTAFMAATIALTQTDLKRILAYSTVSQLGYMVMAMGVGAYASSLFHLVTHAFFKCLLFLIAGIVIHQMQHVKDDNQLDIDPQNINNMGGLRKKLPFTFIAALIASLALVGLPLTSGYLSKDGIVIQSFEWTDGRSAIFKLIPIFALLTTLLTAFYVTRLMVKVFWGEFRLSQVNPGLKLHFTDGGWQYRVPLILLGICCLFPVFSLNPLLYEQAWIFKALNPDGNLERENIYHTLVPVAVYILIPLVIYGTYVIYLKRSKFIFPQSGFFYNLSSREWYIDRFYSQVIVKFVLALSAGAFWFDRTIIDGIIQLLARFTISISKLTAWIDRYIIDGFLNLLTSIVTVTGNFFRQFQGGKVQYYLFSMLAVIAIAFIWYLL